VKKRFRNQERGLPRCVIDTERDEIATPQLAVDDQVEQRQVARAALQLQLGPD